MSYYDTRANIERGPRRLEVKLSDGASLGAPETGWTPQLLALCGMIEVVETTRPIDTATTTTDRSVALVVGTPTVVWTPRLWTAAELTARTAQTNGTTIRTQAATALGNNTAFLTFGAPTNAQIVAQVRALTRQTNGLIRLAINALDATD